MLKRWSTVCCDSPEEGHSSESRRWRGDDKECTSRLYTERDLWATMPGCHHPAEKLKGAGLCGQVGVLLTQSRVLRVRGGEREGRPSENGEWGRAGMSCTSSFSVSSSFQITKCSTKRCSVCSPFEKKKDMVFVLKFKAQ